VLDRFIAISGLLEMLMAVFLLLDPERPLFWGLLIAVAFTLAAATLMFWRRYFRRTDGGDALSRGNSAAACRRK
jgi:hypothetical protein